MEHKIDEIFEVNGITLQAIETEDMHCKNCYFYFNENCNDILCLPTERTDKKNIIFREVNKI